MERQCLNLASFRFSACQASCTVGCQHRQTYKFCMSMGANDGPIVVHFMNNLNEHRSYTGHRRLNHKTCKCVYFIFLLTLQHYWHLVCSFQSPGFLWKNVCTKKTFLCKMHHHFLFFQTAVLNKEWSEIGHENTILYHKIQPKILKQ